MGTDAEPLDDSMSADDWELVTIAPRVAPDRMLPSRAVKILAEEWERLDPRADRSALELRNLVSEDPPWVRLFAWMKPPVALSKARLIEDVTNLSVEDLRRIVNELALQIGLI